MKSFEELGINYTLLEALKTQNITIPTDIQQKVIPEAIKNRDLIVQSETGTGKTLAYLLPLFQKLNTLGRETQAIILVPTHELAVQVLRVIEYLSKNSEINANAALIIGDVNIIRQIDKLREKPHIIVGSAGRILELIKKKKIAAHTVKTIILDEADRLMDQNNIDSVLAIVKSTLKERQLMMYSASISQFTIKRAKEIMKEPEMFMSKERLAVPDTIEHFYFFADKRDKIDVLRKLIRIIDPKKAIVFVAQSGEINIVTEKLQYHGLKVESIHGSDVKLDRKRSMDEFRSGKLQILVASDLAARGLDIENVTHIFNLSMPEEAMAYLHRVGRTGRNGNTGVAISIVSGGEVSLIRMYEKELQIKFGKKEMLEGNIIDAKELGKPIKKPLKSKEK